MTKEQAQARLDQLRKDKRSFQEGTKELKERLHLEMLLDQHLYERTKDG